MQGKFLCFSFSFVLFSFLMFGGVGFGAIASDEPFEFELHTSDVFSWITGEKQGAVRAEKNSMGEALEKFLLGARSNVSFALYGVSRQPWFLQAISTLRERGVKVKGVVDQRRGAAGDWIPENFTYPGTVDLPDYLGFANIAIDLNATGRYPRSAIMHHKYVVLDDSRVWFGTANLSHTGVGAEYNANVALAVSSPLVVRHFADEFRQMFEQHRFGRAKVSSVRERVVVFKDGTEVETYFSPQDDVISAAIEPSIAAARQTIDIGMFYLTARRVVHALCGAAQRGVRVRVITDAVANSHPSSPHWDLQRCGVRIKVENWGGKMHMKTAVIDAGRVSNLVIVGSMNWSNAGNDRNDENLVIIKRNPRLVAGLSDYFHKLWDTLSTKSQRGVIYAEGVSSINSCSDGLDNDHDGLVDGKDGGCRN